MCSWWTVISFHLAWSTNLCVKESHRSFLANLKKTNLVRWKSKKYIFYHNDDRLKIRARSRTSWKLVNDLNLTVVMTDLELELEQVENLLKISILPLWWQTCQTHWSSRPSRWRRPRCCRSWWTRRRRWRPWCRSPWRRRPRPPRGWAEFSFLMWSAGYLFVVEMFWEQIFIWLDSGKTWSLSEPVPIMLAT